MAPVAMLLLDHNLPHQLRDLLTTFGLESETASSRGWERMRNGDLVTAAHGAGFDTIFSRFEVRRVCIEVAAGASDNGGCRHQTTPT
jgi:hypothetical protein